MKKLLLLLLACLIATTYAFSQTSFQELNITTQDSIRQIVVGDPDNNGKRDIYFIEYNKDNIFKLNNNGQNFSKALYYPAKQPQMLAIANLNNTTDDVIFSLKDSSGLQTLYGKDDYNAEKKTGPVLGKGDMVNIKNAHTIKNDLTGNPPKFVNLHTFATGNTIHFWETGSSSFDLIADSKIGKSQYAFNIGKIQGFHISELVSEIYILDNSFNTLRIETVNWSSPYDPVIGQNSVELFEDFADLVDIIGYNKDDKNYLLALDRSEANIYRYNITDGGQRFAFTTNLTSPHLMAIGKIDNDDEEDLIVVANNKIYIASAFEFNRIDLVLVKEVDKFINKLIVADFNGDGFDDIVFTRTQNPGIDLLMNDIGTSTQDVNDVKILVSTMVNNELHFSKNVVINQVIHTSGKSLIENMKTTDMKINTSGWERGMYIINFSADNKTYSEKIIKQ